MPRELQSPPTENWILVRGLLRETGHWGDFPDAFRQHFRQARVYCLDLPGNGRFWRQPTPVSVGEMAHFLRARFAKVLESQKKHGMPALPNYVLSISLGSMVTLEWLTRYPTDLAGAVFINTSLSGLSPFYRRLRPAAFWRLLRLLPVRDPGKREKQILELTSNKADWEVKTLQRWAEIYKVHPVRRTNFFRQLMAAVTYRPPTSKPAAPVLLLNSSHDRLVHASCSERLREHWDLEMKIHGSAGHDLPLDDPQWTLQAIETWLSNVRAPRKAAPVLSQSTSTLPKNLG